MAANTNPISPIAPATSWTPVNLTSANTALDGSGTEGTTISTLITAGANGTKVPRLRVVHKGANVATVMRFFANNGLTNATPANNTLIAEETIAVNALSQVAKSVFYDIPLNFVLKPGYKLMYTIGTAVAAGHHVTTPDAGDY
jgi:hypothetical protein